MKKFWVMLLLGIPSVCFAAVVPTSTTEVRTPTIIQTNPAKRKAIVTQKKLSDEVGSESVASLEKYDGVLTMDNVTAIDNMSRLIQDDPAALIEALGGGNVTEAGWEFDKRKMGSEELVEPYVKTIETDDVKKKYASLRGPELTGSFAEARKSKDEIKALRQRSIDQMLAISQKTLGQKQAPVQMNLTVQDIKDMGIDTRRLPKGWEETLARNEEVIKKAKETGGQATDEERVRIQKLMKEAQEKQAKKQKKK